MKIAIDIMGGDNAPTAIINGSIDFILQNKNNELFLVGTEKAFIEFKLHNLYDEIKDKIKFISCNNFLKMDDNPLIIRTHDEEFTITKCMKLLKQGSVDVVFSAGNSGGVVLAAEAVLGLKEGAGLPAIFAFTKINNNLLGILDAGATGNRSIKAENLLGFAKLGHDFFEKNLNYSNPIIKMLNIGQEENKGTAEHKKAYKLLKNSDLNFQGNIESDKIFSSKVNIIVTDGFTGNIILKLIGSQQNFQNLKKASSNENLAVYENLGGMPLMGINGNVVMAHGKSNAKAIKSALEFASTYKKR